MDHNQFAHTLLEQGPGGAPQFGFVEASIRLPNFEAGGFAGLDFVKNTIINVFQSRGDDSSESLTVFAYDIHAGFDTSMLRLREQAGGPGAELWIRHIERVEQQQVAQMKDTRPARCEIQIVPAPKRVSAAGMEKRSP